MYDFGFLPITLPGLALKTGYKHRKGDFYDVRNVYNKGNTYIKGCSATGSIITTPTDESTAAGHTTKLIKAEIPDWLYMKDLHTDLRMFYLECKKNTGGTYEVVEAIDWGKCHVK